MGSDTPRPRQHAGRHRHEYYQRVRGKAQPRAGGIRPRLSGQGSPGPRTHPSYPSRARLRRVTRPESRLDGALWHLEPDERAAGHGVGDCPAAKAEATNRRAAEQYQGHAHEDATICRLRIRAGRVEGLAQVEHSDRRTEERSSEGPTLEAVVQVAQDVISTKSDTVGSLPL